MILTDEILVYPTTEYLPLTLFISLSVIISLLLFVPAYILEDAGIIYINKKKVKESNKTVEVRGVGNYYLNFLKGYAGIGTLLSIYFLAFDIFTMAGDPQLISMAFSAWFFQPFLLSLLLIPVIIILDKLYERNIKKIQKKGRKLGITSLVNDVMKL